MISLSLRRFLLTAMTIASMGCSLPVLGKDTAGQSQKNLLKIADRNAIFFLRLPKNDSVTYQGVVGNNGPGMDGGQMLYPAVDLISFLAAVVTHAVIVDSVKRGKKSKVQEAADQVLLPYQEVLSTFRLRDLMQRGIGKTSSGDRMKLMEASETPGGGWTIESAPVFAMTQDQSAIVLDNLILIYATDTPAGPSYRNVVRVVSKAREDANPVELWTADRGEKLKEESATLFAQSLDMVMDDVRGDSVENKNPYKTVRYFLGKTEKMERSQLLSEKCDRKVIRNLRGWLMSIPVQPAGGAAPIPDPCVEPLKTTGQ